MKDKNGRDIHLGDTLVSGDPLGITQTRYIVTRLGAFPNSDIVIEQQFSDGIRRPWCASYLNSLFAGLCYAVETTADAPASDEALVRSRP